MEGRALTPADKAIITQRILAAWLLCPDQRLGQLISNALGNAGSPDLFYVEDDAFIAAIEAFADALEKKD